MVSEKTLKPYSKYDYPELAEPKYIRFKFRKVGDLQYISHLDLQRTMGRVLIRAKAPLWYSKGFNPHPKLIFALPLSVGTQSVCEFLDVRVERDIPPSVMMEHINYELTDELYILDAYYAQASFSDIKWAEYDYEIRTLGADEALCGKISELLTTSPLNIVKKTKSGMKEIDIVPLISKVEVKLDSEIIKISATLSANADKYLNPEFIITALKEKLGILSHDLASEEYSIMRKRVLFENGEDFR